MFLTRMALDINRPEAAELLASPARLDDLVHTVSPEEHVLWRLDEISSKTWLVMFSRLRPDLIVAHTRYGYPGIFPSWDTIPIDDDLDAMWSGSRWAFELCGGPPDLPASSDPAQVTEEALIAWLRETAKADGFSLSSVSCKNPRLISAGEKTLILADFSGMLTVADENRFLHAVLNGIGGCSFSGSGLMTLSRSGSVWE